MIKIPQHADNLLRRTARSFYLTLHALPEAIQWPISLGYLLARSTDTVADVIELPAKQRASILKIMLEMIDTGPNAQLMRHLLTYFSALKTNSAEFELLTNFDKYVKSLYELSPEFRNEIISVLNKIITGQQLDIERFQQKVGALCLKTIEELDTYTYLVAGSVGEFWTNICLQQWGDYSKLPNTEIYPLAISFGKGLQLVNILRDLSKDLHAGRCYLPSEQLQQFKIDNHHVLSNLKALTPIIYYWQQKALSDLRAGWKYMLSIKQRRIRSALALPLLLGFASLQKMQDLTYLEKKEPLKVSRKQVKLFMLISILGLFTKQAFLLARLTRFRKLL